MYKSHGFLVFVIHTCYPGLLETPEEIVHCYILVRLFIKERDLLFHRGLWLDVLRAVCTPSTVRSSRPALSAQTSPKDPWLWIKFLCLVSLCEELNLKVQFRSSLHFSSRKRHFIHFFRCWFTTQFDFLRMLQDPRRFYRFSCSLDGRPGFAWGRG